MGYTRTTYGAQFGSDVVNKTCHPIPWGDLEVRSAVSATCPRERRPSCKPVADLLVACQIGDTPRTGWHLVIALTSSNPLYLARMSSWGGDLSGSIKGPSVEGTLSLTLVKPTRPKFLGYLRKGHPRLSYLRDNCGFLWVHRSVDIANLHINGHLKVLRITFIRCLFRSPCTSAQEASIIFGRIATTISDIDAPTLPRDRDRLPSEIPDSIHACE